MNDMMTVMPVLAVKPWLVVMIVLIVVLVAAFVALTIYGKKLQDRQESSQKELEAAAQSMKLLVIDKKRMKFKDSGLPAMVLDQVPKYMRGRKVPIVKAKIGPRIMSLICEEKVYDLIPVKKEIRATVSGIYIMDVKGLRGGLEQVDPKKKKKKLGEKLREKADQQQKELKQQKAIKEKELGKRKK